MLQLKAITPSRSTSDLIEQWPVVLDLAATLDTPLYKIGQWGRWEQVLQLQLQAAEATGDQAAAALALHQLGSRALCWGDALTAHDRPAI